MWPIEGHNDRDNGSDAEENEDHLGTQIATEFVALTRPKLEKRFANCLTNTQCVIFMSCKPPVDPVKLMMKHVETLDQGSQGIDQRQRTSDLHSLEAAIGDSLSLVSH
jgi:tRNA acetyltransferase TAN1